MHNTKYVVCICGPTAVGKSSIAHALAKHYHTSILSADARQCLIEMNIGTAKPSVEDMAELPYYFVNTHHIHQDISAGMYESYALDAINEIHKNSDIAIVVGGTGLYIKTLLEGLDTIPEVRASTSKNNEIQYEIHGIDWLRSMILQHDNTYAQQGDMQNPHRMLRALNVAMDHGVSILNFQKAGIQNRPWIAINIGIDMERTALYQRINERVDEMWQQGLREEVIQLYPYRQLKNLKTVGYQEYYMDDVLPNSDTAWYKATEMVKQHTRNYAKRQMTWFKNKHQLQWYGPSEMAAIISYIDNSMKDRE